MSLIKSSERNQVCGKIQWVQARLSLTAKATLEELITNQEVFIGEASEHHNDIGKFAVGDDPNFPYL